MSFRDISHHIKEMYDMDIFHATLASIADKVNPAIKEWQSRPLEELEEKWGEEYAVVIDSWRNNWERLSYTSSTMKPFAK